MRKQILSLFLVLNFIFGYGQSVSLCPFVNAGADVTICNGQCTKLVADGYSNNATNTYALVPIAYTPFSFTGTQILNSIDDQWSAKTNIGFSFNYFGINYNKFIVGSNGQISFDTSKANLSEPWIISNPIPNVANGKTTISACYRDINPATGGTIKYQLIGTAPCRALVVSWINIPLFSTGCDSLTASTFQAVLYETSNKIEVYVQNSSSCINWNGGYGIIGVQDSSGTIGVSTPPRNYPAAWSAINEAWRFTPSGPSSYLITWSDTSGVIGTGNEITVCPDSTMQYTSTLVVTNPDSSTFTFVDSLIVSVNQNNSTTPSINVNSASICFGSSATLSATGALVYSWAPSYGLNINSDSIVIANPPVTTTYTVTASNGSCADTAIAIVTVNQPGQAAITVSDINICLGDSSTLTASGGNTFTWAPALTLDTIAGTTVVATPTVTTTYTLTSLTTGCTGSSQATKIVYVVKPITSGTITPTPPTCQGTCTADATLVLTGGSNSTNDVTWSNGDSLPTLLNVCPGTYYVTVTNSICPSVYNDSITLVDLPVLIANTTVVDNVCLNNGVGSIQVSATGGAGSPYTFALNAGAFSTVNNFTNLTAATYTVKARDKNACLITLNVPVTQTANNAPSLLVNSDTICLGSSTNLICSGANTYTWLPTTALSAVTGPSVVSTPNTSITYTVTGRDASNCSATTTSSILVMTSYTEFPDGSSVCIKPAVNVTVYNSFSPNGDGLNDAFVIDDIERFNPNHVYIYNRWGQLVWDKANYDNIKVVWDGKDNAGNSLAVGTYFYIIELNGLKTAKSWVELIK